MRLTTAIWVAALLRRVELGGAYAVVATKGDAYSGAVLIKVSTLNGEAVLYRSVQGMAGERIWWPKGPQREAEIERYIAGRLQNDPDMWCVEIEDRHGRHFIDEIVEI